MKKNKRKWIIRSKQNIPTCSFDSCNLNAELVMARTIAFRTVPCMIITPTPTLPYPTPFANKKVGVKITHLWIKKSCFSQIITRIVTFLVGSFSFFLSCEITFSLDPAQLLQYYVDVDVVWCLHIIKSTQLVVRTMGHLR